MLTTSSPVQVGSGVAVGQPVNWSHPLNRGRVAWYLSLPGRMSGPTWYDLCGRIHGTLTNGPKWGGTTRPGGYGAVASAGSPAYVAYPVTAADILTGSQPFTFACWVRFSAVSGTQALFDQRTAINLTPAIIYLDSAGKLRCYREALGDLIGATTLAASTWYHVAYKWDGAAAALYVNGAPDASRSEGAGTTLAPTFGTLLASSQGSGTRENFAAAAIDDATLYMRGLSDGEVKRLYDVSRAGHPGTLNRLGPSLVAFPAAGGTDATASPATATAAWTAVTPSVAAGATITPATVTAAWTSNVPTVSAGATAAPGTVAAAWTVGVPAVAGDAAASPASATASWIAGAPAVAADATTSPSTAIAAWAAQDPAVAAGATVATASAGAEWAANSPSFGGVVATSTDPGFSLAGTGWTNAGTAGRGYAGGTFYYSGTADDTATFAVALPSAGTYKVAITYESASFRNQDTGVVVKDGATTLLSTTIDQTVAPDDFVYNGSGFEVLSPSLTFSGVTATVVLTVPTNTFYSIADAVYFESVAGGGFRPAWASHPATIGCGVY